MGQSELGWEFSLVITFLQVHMEGEEPLIRLLSSMWGFRKLGADVGSPSNEDHRILGSHIGTPGWASGF